MALVTNDLVAYAIKVTVSYEVFVNYFPLRGFPSGS